MNGCFFLFQKCQKLVELDRREPKRKNWELEMLNDRPVIW